MIKDDTQVVLSFSNDNFSADDATNASEALQNLQSIRNLKLDFKDSTAKIDAIHTVL
jgi:hypothetical protein